MAVTFSITGFWTPPLGARRPLVPSLRAAHEEAPLRPGLETALMMYGALKEHYRADRY